MVLVVVRGDGTLIRGYGETEKGNGHTPDGTSLLRLNSITKVFTTEVLVALAAEGKLALTDPLQRFAGDAKVPQFAARPITLLDLATHSGGVAARDGRRPRRRQPPRLADAGGSVEMAARLHSCRGRPAPSPRTPMSASTSWPMRSRPPAASPTRTCCAAASPRRSA